MMRISKKRHAEIANFLLHDWDPIGIRDEANAQDEYDNYVGRIDFLIQQGASTASIAGLLMQIAKEEMALRPNRQNAEAAAHKLALLGLM